MRGIDTIESDFLLVAMIRRTAHGEGMPMPTIALADKLLDEWLVTREHQHDRWELSHEQLNSQRSDQDPVKSP